MVTKLRLRVAKKKKEFGPSSPNSRRQWRLKLKIIEGFAASKKVLSRQVTTVSYPVSPKMRQGLQKLFGTGEPEEAVRKIVAEVQARGDAALTDFTFKIDGIKLTSLEVSKEQIARAYKEVDKTLVSALKQSAENIRFFHQKQKDNIWHELNEGNLRQIIRPLQRAGLYVPGGTASYPSTVLMTAVPAKVAGVGEIILVSPPKSNGAIPAMTLVAADIAGVDRVFNIGGAQAVAALAYGTQSVPNVDKICGPGNIFVMLAKKLVYGTVAIDGLQGPSEVLIIADETAKPEFCAADLLAQAEHDTLAATVLVTTSRKVADEVLQEIERQITELSRPQIIRESLEHGIIAIVKNVNEAIDLANLYAPEHLCLLMKDAAKYVDRINNAGCVVAGDYATVVLGDYVAGPSHALPTGGTARFSSPLNVSDFFKFINVIHEDKASVTSLGQAASVIARAEGLDAHARAIERRMGK
ncbi:MAG: histidinol dehydrogenase [Dehalococcoidales bacterium]|nr:histidinol dehydrogenase [Dehalococcoidales bacterium]